MPPKQVLKTHNAARSGSSPSPSRSNSKVRPGKVVLQGGKRIVQKEETEEQKSQREKEEKRIEFIQKHCTILEFKYADQTHKSIQCDRLMNWMDLQREIARNNPGIKLFMVQNKGLLITAENFHAGPSFQVKEVFMAKIPR